jgi:hypothetical protein
VIHERRSEVSNHAPPPLASGGQRRLREGRARARRRTRLTSGALQPSDEHGRVPGFVPRGAVSTCAPPPRPLHRRARRWFRRLPSGESGRVDAPVEPALSARVRADVLGGGGSRFRSSLPRQAGRGATRRPGTRLRSASRARGGSRAACRARSGRRARRTPRGRARRPKTAARARRRTARSRRGR